MRSFSFIFGLLGFFAFSISPNWSSDFPEENEGRRNAQPSQSYFGWVWSWFGSQETQHVPQPLAHFNPNPISSEDEEEPEMGVNDQTHWDGEEREEEEELKTPKYYNDPKQDFTEILPFEVCWIIFTDGGNLDNLKRYRLVSRLFCNISNQPFMLNPFIFKEEKHLSPSNLFVALPENYFKISTEVWDLFYKGAGINAKNLFRDLPSKWKDQRHLETALTLYSHATGVAAQNKFLKNFQKISLKQLYEIEWLLPRKEGSKDPDLTHLPEFLEACKSLSVEKLGTLYTLRLNEMDKDMLLRIIKAARGDLSVDKTNTLLKGVLKMGNFLTPQIEFIELCSSHSPETTFKLSAFIPDAYENKQVTKEDLSKLIAQLKLLREDQIDMLSELWALDKNQGMLTHPEALGILKDFTPSNLRVLWEHLPEDFLETHPHLSIKVLKSFSLMEGDLSVDKTNTLLKGVLKMGNFLAPQVEFIELCSTHSPETTFKLSAFIPDVDKDEEVTEESLSKLIAQLKLLREDQIDMLSELWALDKNQGMLTHPEALGILKNFTPSNLRVLWEHLPENFLEYSFSIEALKSLSLMEEEKIKLLMNLTNPFFGKTFYDDTFKNAAALDAEVLKLMPTFIPNLDTIKAMDLHRILESFIGVSLETLELVKTHLFSEDMSCMWLSKILEVHEHLNLPRIQLLKQCFRNLSPTWRACMVNSLAPLSSEKIFVIQTLFLEEESGEEYENSKISENASSLSLEALKQIAPLFTESYDAGSRIKILKSMKKLSSEKIDFLKEHVVREDMYLRHISEIFTAAESLTIPQMKELTSTLKEDASGSERYDLLMAYSFRDFEETQEIRKLFPDLKIKSFKNLLSHIRRTSLETISSFLKHFPGEGFSWKVHSLYLQCIEKMDLNQSSLTFARIREIHDLFLKKGSFKKLYVSNSRNSFYLSSLRDFLEVAGGYDNEKFKKISILFSENMEVNYLLQLFMIARDFSSEKIAALAQAFPENLGYWYRDDFAKIMAPLNASQIRAFSEDSLKESKAILKAAEEYVKKTTEVSEDKGDDEEEREEQEG